jgi:hypothetical protein
MITATGRTGRGLALAAALFGAALAGCQSTASSGAQTQAAPDPEQLRLESAPPAEREGLATAQREADAAAELVPNANRMLERRALETRLANEEAEAARAFVKAARARAELAQKFGQEAGLDSAPVLSLVERAEMAAKQADIRQKAAKAREDHARAMVPVALSQVAVTHRKVEAARERALAATRPGVETIAYPPLAKAERRLADAQADLARAQQRAVERQAEVEAQEYQLNRLGQPVVLTANPSSGTWPALGTAMPATPTTGAAVTPRPAAPVAPVAAPVAPRPVVPAAATPPTPSEAAGGGAVVFEPSGPSGRTTRP